MILQNQIFPIGQITKTHGINGELSFTFTSNVFDSEEAPFFVLDMDGIFVPFFIQEYRFKTDESGFLKLDGINSEQLAQELVGKTLYLPNNLLTKVKPDEIELDYFIGFTLIDETDGLIGEIIDVDQSTPNTLFIINKKGKELLIPVGEEYIVEVMHKKKEILVKLPEGLLDLYEA